MKKHPTYEILQDYFENALKSSEESVVNQHLLECDQCTNVLGQFAVIETRLLKIKPLEVSQETQAKIFSGVNSLLAQRRNATQARHQDIDNLKDHFQQWKTLFYPELRMPALQLCSIALLAATFVAVEKNASREESIYKPLSTDVTIVTPEDK